MLDHIPALLQDQAGKEKLLCATTAFFDYVRENECVFRVLFSESVNSGFSSHLVELVCSQYYSRVESEDALSTQYLRLYMANGNVGMLREWLASGFRISSRKLAEMIFFFPERSPTEPYWIPRPF